jgi:FtsH-binding integral membrane protein
VSGGSDEHAEESRRQRINRELIELLNELRVALPGVQVLFAFLLAVPFSAGYSRTTAFQRATFIVVLAATAISTAFFIAPSAYHRLNFREGNKEQILHWSNRFMVVGMGFLATAMVGVIVLVMNVVYSAEATIALGVLSALVFVGLWFIFPLVKRRS